MTGNDAPPNVVPGIRRWFSLALKLGLTLGALVLVFLQADVTEIQAYVKRADPLWLVAAFLMLNVGQVLSGLRMRFYFATAGLMLSRGFAVALYYVGMLFNLILPGGIGGDGYKAYFLQKKRGFSWKTAVRLIISGRASGLLALCVLTLIIAWFSPLLMEVPIMPIILMLGMVAVFPCYSFAVRKMLREPLPIQLRALPYSLAIQLTVVVAVWWMLVALGATEGRAEYLVLFMLSSIVSILPISLGGVGLRELTFFYGAALFGTSPEFGVTLSMLYFAVNTLASLAGVVSFARLQN